MEFVPSLPIPAEGVLVLTIPTSTTGVRIPNANTLTMTCYTGCTQAGTFSLSGTELTIRNAFKNGYV